MTPVPYWPKPGDTLHVVKDGVTYIRQIKAIENRSDYGFLRLFTINVKG